MPGEDLYSWSTTAASNSNADTLINWAEGQPRASVNNSARSMMAAHAKQRDRMNGSIQATGTPNVLSFSSGGGYTVIPTGMRVLLKIGPELSNTGSTSLNMDGIGALPIVDFLGRGLLGGELQAGDYVELVYNGTTWILLHENSGTTLLATSTAASSASVAFPIGSYDEYLIVLTNILPAVNTAILYLRFSYDGGSTYDAGANYWYGAKGQASHAVVTDYSSGILGDGYLTAFFLNGGQDNTGGFGLDGEVRLYGPTSAYRKRCSWHTGCTGSFDVGEQGYIGTGTNVSSAAALSAVQFSYSGGTILAGKFQLYGVRI